jgi:hypothetical protein
MVKARHVTRMGERSAAYTVLVGKPEGRRPLRKTTFTRIFKKLDREVWTALI